MGNDNTSEGISEMHTMLFFSKPYKELNCARLLIDAMDAAPPSARKMYVSRLELN